MRLVLLSVALLFTFTIHAQIIINEVDADTPGVDTKEFVELKTENPFTSLDGYVLVHFNGSNFGSNQVWWTFDLDGYQTDVNGLFTIGGPELTPVPNAYMPINTILNGNAALGVYSGSSSDFPEGTLATTSNLIDALVYSVGNPPSQTLLDLMGETEHIDEDVNGNKDFESMQRDNEGDWFVDEPTPRALNDGTGVILNGVAIKFDEEIIEEGDVIEIEFETDFPVDEDLVIEFTLENGDFNQNDFTGETTATILQGETTGSTTIEILLDNQPEDDELMIITMLPLDQTIYMKNNNNIEVWVLDADFFVSPFGTPLEPTYGIVQPAIPSGYYSSLDGKSGEELKQALQDIIAEEGVARIHPYEDVWEMLNELDQNPKNSNQVWRVYLESPEQKFLRQVTSSGIGRWNREHVFPRSRGGFFAYDDFDDFPTGINVWQTTNADSLRHGMSDIHSLRVADATENNVRGNQHFGQYTGPTGNQGSFYGDVSRSIFYMAVRYNGLEVVEGFPTETQNGELGDLNTMLDWHDQDPPDDFEMNRNNLAWNWQRNRNPFIDLPDLVDYIFGDKQDEIWNNPMSAEDFNQLSFSIYPNPSQGSFYIEGLDQNANIQIFNMQGKKVHLETIFPNQEIQANLSSGTYIIKIDTENSSQVQRIIIN
ncbi:MAG: endonuclease [Flavobacteriaceae bacterium]|nr:endonuclease [Flavobacteriaceae bacterium]